MKPIRAVFCDFGSVLYKTPDVRWLIHLQRLLGRKVDETLLALYQTPTQSPLNKAVMCGQIPESQIWEGLIRRFGLSPAMIARLRSGSFAPKRLNRPMIHALQRLRPRFQTAILTNAGSDFRATFCRAFEIETWADQVIISAEEGMAKPDPALFYLAAARLQIRPEQALLIDDVAENVEGARATGMQAFQFVNNRQALKALETHLT